MVQVLMAVVMKVPSSLLGYKDMMWRFAYIFREAKLKMVKLWLMVIKWLKSGRTGQVNAVVDQRSDSSLQCAGLWTEVKGTGK